MNKFLVIENTSLDKFLDSFYISKSNQYKIKNSDCFINGVKMESTNLNKGDIIEFNLAVLDKKNILPYKSKLDIVYEDDYILVINKPINMLTHPDGVNNNSLANAVSFYYSIYKLDIGVRPLHRLDYQTSGLIVFAKDALSHSYINYQFENCLVKKEYIALLEGNIDKDNGVLDYPIGRNRHNSKKYLVSKTGKDALTKYKVIQRYEDKTLVKVWITTGRPHQIRVHFSHINHPIIGDSLYGEDDVRMFLHASKLSFMHPVLRKDITIEKSPLKGDNSWIL